jgi:lysophospholipid acyltransferase
MYEHQIIHPIAMMIVSYLIMRFYTREKQHLIVFAFLYAYQSWLHIDRMIYNYGEWGGEVTSFTMNLVCRLISLGFCFRDGSPKVQDENFKNSKKIADLPPFYKIIGYTYNIPSCIASPFFEYKDYEDWMELKHSYSHIPDTFWPGVKRFLTTLLWLSILTVLSVIYKPTLLATENFCSKSYFSQGIQFYMTMNVIKYTYFTAFSLNDAALVASGLAYNPAGKHEGRSKFDRIKNIDERMIETGHYLKKQVAKWNMTISGWLKKYVYVRLASNNKDGPGVFEFIVTFLMSAFWHGFYPGYYIFFIYIGVLTYSSGEIKNYYSWYFRLLPKRIARFLAGFWTYYFCSYIVPIFAIYDVRDIFYYYNCQYWHGHIILFLFFAFTISPLGSKLKRNIKEMQRKEVEKQSKKDQ